MSIRNKNREVALNGERNGSIHQSVTEYRSLEATETWVENRINATSAYYLTYNADGDAFPTYSDLVNASVYYSGGKTRTPTRNDYAIVDADETHEGTRWRYIYGEAEDDSSETSESGEPTTPWEPQYPITTGDYEELSNKPSINGETIEGNKTSAELGLADLDAIDEKRDKTDLAVYHAAPVWRVTWGGKSWSGEPWDDETYELPAVTPVTPYSAMYEYSGTREGRDFNIRVAFRLNPDGTYRNSFVSVYNIIDDGWYSLEKTPNLFEDAEGASWDTGDTYEMTFAGVRGVSATAVVPELDNSLATTKGVNGLLAEKVDKEQGKGLSTNDFTNYDKGVLDGIVAAMPEDASEDNKVADRAWVDRQIGSLSGDDIPLHLGDDSSDDSESGEMQTVSEAIEANAQAIENAMDAADAAHAAAANAQDAADNAQSAASEAQRLADDAGRAALSAQDLAGRAYDTARNAEVGISLINEKIPQQASSSNQLADKDFVNSSIATNTATFRGSYNLVSDLGLPVADKDDYAVVSAAIAAHLAGLEPPIAVDNNDYCFVQIPTADATPTEISRIDRYKCTVTESGGTTTRTWGYEFSLNNSSFTAAQWAAINSGITSADVAKLSALPDASTLAAALLAKVARTELFPAWAANTAYTTYSLVIHENAVYKCTTAHTSGAEWDSTKWAVASGAEVLAIIRDYRAQSNKPSINGVALSGNKTAADLGLATKADATLTKRFSAWTLSGDVEAGSQYEVRFDYDNDGATLWGLYKDGNLFSTGSDNPLSTSEDFPYGLFPEEYTITATRTALFGYQLGSQTNKVLASEAEAEALRQGKASTADATLTPFEFGDWSFSGTAPQAGHNWSVLYVDTLSPHGYRLFSVDSQGNMSIASVYLSENDDATSLSFDNGTVATRTVLGYQLGSQDDKPLASEAEAEALRTDKADKPATFTTGDLASLDANGNLAVSGMNRDANGNLNATSFSFQQSQVVDYGSLAVGVVVDKSVTPVVLYSGEYWLVRKSFAKTGNWNNDVATGRIIKPGASGVGSTAWGEATSASGNGADSEGKNTKAVGAGAHSEGQDTDATATCAHAEGLNTTASGTCSHTEGNGTTAQNLAEHAQGQYNASHKASATFGGAGNTLASVGCGTSGNDRKNAIEVMQDGKVYVKGVDDWDGNSNPGLTAEGADLAAVINGKAAKSDIPYALAVASSTVSGSTVTATIADCTVNSVVQEAGQTDFVMDFPDEVQGKVRDFVLTFECTEFPPNITWNTYADFIGEATTSLVPEEGMNVYAFTEVSRNKFYVTHKMLTTLASNAPATAENLITAMASMGYDTTDWTSLDDIRTALDLPMTATIEDCLNAVFN